MRRPILRESWCRLAVSVSFILVAARVAAPQTPQDPKNGPILGDSPWCGMHLIPERTGLRAVPSLAATAFAESEPNGTQGTADFVPLGFGLGEDAAFTLTGVIDAPPAPRPSTRCTKCSPRSADAWESCSPGERTLRVIPVARNHPLAGC